MMPEPGVKEIVRLLANVRWREVLVQQGTPLFGALFSIGAITSGKSAALALLMAASCCLFAHVFVFNDWSGIDGDRRDPRRSASVFLEQGISRRAVGYLSIALMGLSLALLAPLGVWPLGLGAGVLLLSALYSAPGLHFKGTPLVSSVLHFAGGLLHFLLGYALFAAVDARALAIGGFFALTSVAGHLSHETRDWEGDSLNRIRTNAVRFGQRRCFAASFAFFTASYALLAGLGLFGVIPHLIVWTAALYPFHLYWTVRTLRAGLSFEALAVMQARYRLLYGIIGMILMVALLPSLVP